MRPRRRSLQLERIDADDCYHGQSYGPIELDIHAASTVSLQMADGGELLAGCQRHGDRLLVNAWV